MPKAVHTLLFGVAMALSATFAAPAAKAAPNRPLSAPSAPASEAPAQPNPALASAIETLSDPARPADDLAAAARTVLTAAPTNPQALRAATDAIAAADAPGRQVLAAIASLGSAPPALWEPVARRWPAAAPDEKTLLAAAAAAFRTPDAAFALITATADTEPAPVRDAAFAALIRMTGRDDLAKDTAAWRAWYLESVGMSRRQWQERLLASQSQRAESLRRDSRRLAQQVASLYRRLWSATPADAREALLVELLAAESDPVRALAMELIRTEIAEGRAIGPSATAAATALLSHPAGSVRAEAATLIKQLAPDDAGTLVLATLNQETDRAAAAALLSAIARWPSPDAEPAILRWLGADPPLPVAAEAALAHVRADFFATDESRNVLRSLLRDQPDADLSSSALRLLAEIGTPDDRDRVASIMKTGTVEQRVAAANALVDLPEFTDAIAAAAAEDARLFEWAVRAVRAHRPTVEGILRIAAIGSVPEDQVRRSVVALAEPLDLADIVALAGAVTDRPALRESVLTLVTAPERVPTDQPPAPYADALLDLAEVRLQLDRPAEAIAALDRLPDELAETAAARSKTLRARALLATDQLEAARALTPPAAVWIEALQRLLTEPTDPGQPDQPAPADPVTRNAAIAAILEVLDADFADALTEPQAAIVTAARQRLAPAPTDPAATNADASAEPTETAAGDPADPPGSNPAPTGEPASNPSPNPDPTDEPGAEPAQPPNDPPPPIG